MKVTKPSLNNGHTAMQEFICLGDFVSPQAVSKRPG